MADRPAGNPRGSRSAVLARNGVIATSQPLASAAGLRVLQSGGNAVDAAITAAAVLGVVEPTMTGVGGDVFAIVYDPRAHALRGLNSSGRAGARADADALVARGITAMPADGVYPITVPGAVAGWAALLEEFGTITLGHALEPAIRYARDGYAVSEIIAAQWAAAASRLDLSAAAVFLPAGRAPTPGELFRNPDLARTLEQIARDGATAVYQGPIGERIARDNQARGGFLTVDDFAAHRADWVDPISTTYRGYELYELPPNTQGFVALEMLNILEGYDVPAFGHNSADYLHRLAEAKRIAFADRGAFLADPALVPSATLATLVSKEYAATRRREIDDARVSPQIAPAAAFAGRDRGDTVYLAAADGQGQIISFINSLFSDFGSGVVTPGTGVMLHNRGLGFTLEQGHPNRLGPGKRPLHTLVPAFLMKDGRPLMAFGVMGGDNQAQAHAQVVVNVVDFGMNVQEAGDAPRVRHLDEGLAVERGIAPDVLRSLHARGHVLLDGRGAVGGYQAVMVDPVSGVMMGGSDPRKDGQAVGY
jgi:gamma-glutamyltranspeptidase/glutathione hydrolase